MFPNYPNLICRRCTHVFEVTNEMLAGTKILGRIECPECKYETTGTGVQSFLKFYPRLVNSERIMASEGISLSCAGVNDIMGLGHYSWLKEEMVFQCNGCARTWSIKFDPDTLHFKNNPNRFFCPSCFKKPQTSTTKEFFMCLNQTFESAFKFTHAQWDVFSLFGIPIPLHKIQSKVFAKKFLVKTSKLVH